MSSNKDQVPHEIVHGTDGDAKLEHTQHEAPMPKGEKGDGKIDTYLYITSAIYPRTTKLSAYISTKRH